jgi:hypothetical protein
VLGVAGADRHVLRDLGGVGTAQVHGGEAVAGHLDPPALDVGVDDHHAVQRVLDGAGLDQGHSREGSGPTPGCATGIPWTA